MWKKIRFLLTSMNISFETQNLESENKKLLIDIIYKYDDCHNNIMSGRTSYSFQIIISIKYNKLISK